MKTLINSASYPDPLILKNLVVDGTIQTNSVLASGSSSFVNLSTTTITSNTTTTNTLNAQAINLGGSPLALQSTWTPIFQTLRGDRAGNLFYENWNDQFDTSTAGVYTKVGKAVTAWFSCKCSFNGFRNDVLWAPRYPIVRNLPFRCNDPSIAINLEYETIVSNVAFPDNYVGPIPIPLVTTYEGSYTARLVETGTVFVPRIPPLYDTSGLDTIVLDGKTITFECIQASRIPTIADWTKEGTVTNAPVLALGNYTISFTSSLTYFTDE